MRHKHLFLAIALVCFAAGLPQAAAQEAFLSNEPDKAFVAAAIEAANGLLPQGRLLDGSPVAPVTPEERREGVIPGDAADLIVRLAADTALAEFCQLDWKQLSFRPIMRRERARGLWSDRQIAYIGILHGFVQGQFLRLLERSEVCTAKHRRAVAEFFAEKQW